MRHIPGRLLLALAVAGVVGWVWPRSPAAGNPARQAAPAGAAGAAPAEVPDGGDKWVGVASCTSSACHGQNGPKGSKGSEYTAWAGGGDKHPNAFTVLYNDRSQRIARNLYGENAKPATEQPLCLKCHASHDGIVDERVSDRFQVGDGVGCESCHGPAGRWLTVHYQPWFLAQKDDEKAKYGMRPTKDIVVRAKLCTTCHVGTKDQEVNHDLIAAGHPRLAFELGAYHGIYNKHWDIRADHRRYPDFEARLWQVGQAASAVAALELLAARAEGAKKEGDASRPWPEFAEYDCFACHRSLQVLPVDSPRPAAASSRRVGTLPYGTWYLALTDVLGRQDAERGGEVGNSLAALKRLMQSPSPDPTPAANQAKELARALEGWMLMFNSEAKMGRGRVEELFAGLAGEGARRGDRMGWDEATQYYLGLAAYQQARSDLGGADVPPALLALRNRLRNAFPDGDDSPRAFNALAGPPLTQQFNTIAKKLGN